MTFTDTLLLPVLLGLALLFFFLLAIFLYRALARGARLEAELARLEEKAARQLAIEEELSLRQAEVSELNRNCSTLREKIARLETTLEQERSQSAEKLSLLQEMRESFQTSFKALSADALKHNNQSFLQLAEENLSRFQQNAKADLEKREQAINELVAPIKESLQKVDTKIEQVEKARSESFVSLREQLGFLSQANTDLQKETSNLVKALRVPHIRGRWGEFQLRRVVEMANMVEYCDFVEQDSEASGGKLRPDMIIRLPSERKVVVDSKVALDAYFKAMDASTDEERVQRLKEHAGQVRTHITQLSAKSYWTQYQPGVDFVVLFLQGETFFYSALQADPELIEFGVDKKVLIATPTTLVSMLRVVAYGWRQEQLAENARKISEIGTELYDRLRVLADHFEGIRKGLDSSVNAYNSAVGSLESRVLTSVRKFKELGCANEKAIPELSAVEKTPQSLRSL